MMGKIEANLGRITEMAVQNRNIPHFPGLFYGKMGVVVFLCQYSSYTQNTKYLDFAFKLISEINSQIYGKSNVNYNYGLSGIGVAIEYLVQNNYLEADTDDILEDFDFTLSFFLKKISFLSSYNQILDVGKYFSYRINNTKKQDKIILMIERILTIIEMEVVRNSFCSVKTLLLLNSLCHVLDKANKLFLDNFKIQIDNVSGKNNLRWEYLLTKVKNATLEDKSFNFKEQSVDLNTNDSNQQLIEQIMLSLISGNEIGSNLLNLLIQKVEIGKCCLFSGQIGIALTILSVIDKKYATWFDLL